ncbi:MAG: phosphoribosylamine--glycine ligase [Planctomycetes bacterium]|nr:phosphoribosylamine--glycine ligase [Planctomycetota bacterium]
MKVLVVGSGGREHALCWKLAQSPLAPELLCAPGNPGTARLARNVPVQANDVPGLVDLARREKPDLVVVGPEDPLVAGLADKLRTHGIAVFGPGAKGARLEGSKVFAKEVLERHRIPCAQDRVFDRSGTAKSYLENCTQWPQVIKADGLAGGKGVVICHDPKSACQAVDMIMEQKALGSAGTKIVVEEFLQGEEASVLAITDGETILILEPVQDHKQVGEGDTGPNTGGMGVYSPVASLNRRLQRQIEQHVLVPTLHALRHEEIEFRGMLFVGLMMTDNGPRVLEYNVRFGDPECQALVRRMKSDLLPILLATAKGELSKIEPPEWDERVCVGVVAAAEGYPGTVRKGDAIEGLDAAEAHEDVVVFHAGTSSDKSGRVLTSGGRVLCVSALGADLNAARERAYAGYDEVRYAGKFCRRDIGTRHQSKPGTEPEERPHRRPARDPRAAEAMRARIERRIKAAGKPPAPGSAEPGPTAAE